MRITLKPDVYTAAKSRIDETPEWFGRTELYAKNKLAIMASKGNPKQVKKLADLGRSDVRVSMPNPEWERIEKRIEEAYSKVGVKRLETPLCKLK